MFDVSIYRSVSHPNGLPGQLEALHTISSDKRDGLYYLDGVVHRGDESRRIVGVPIRPGGVSVGALNQPEKHTAKEDIWIQTVTGFQKGDLWYKVESSSDEYASLLRQYLWFADLVKHVADFIAIRREGGKRSSLMDFAEVFSKQLQAWHGEDGDFISWLVACNNVTDFRKHLLRFAPALRNHLFKIDGIDEQPLWLEIGAAEDPDQVRRPASIEEQTVVTPDVRESFLQCFPHWGRDAMDLLRAVPYARSVTGARQGRLRALRLPNNLGPGQSKHFVETGKDGKLSRISLLLEQAALSGSPTTVSLHDMAGKVIVVRRTGRDRELEYKYAWAHSLSSNATRMRIIWLLKPSMTMCGSEDDGTYYPVGNELFIDQDSCKCSDVARAEDILAVYNATVLGADYGSDPELLVRQAYSEQNKTITLAAKEDLRCRLHERHHRRENLTSTTEDPNPEDAEVEKLRNLCIFAGCGLADHSLEDTGIFETVQAFDTNSMALTSHRLNTKPNQCKHYCESVNSRLEKMIKGYEPICAVHCLTAGSPCQGYSTLNRFRKNRKGQRNCSLLAAAIAWVEVHLPLFVIIENVPAMDTADPKEGRGNACAQAISHLVAFGYQVRKMVLSAESYGGNTRRKRLFLIAAAPVMVLPGLPSITHGDSPELEPEVLVSDTIKNLEDIDEHIAINPRRPDHIPIIRLKPLLEESVSLRSVVERIPTHRPGLGLAESYSNLTPAQQRWFKGLHPWKTKKGSTSLRRIHSEKPYQTIVTKAIPLDACGTGELLHPRQHRAISFEERRRGQGIPDWFLLAGNMISQLQQTGNGWPWQFGIAIGREVGKAWQQSCEKLPELRRQLRSEQEAGQLVLADDTAASEGEHSSDEQIQRELRATLDQSSHAGTESPMGDTIVFRPSLSTPPEADNAATSLSDPLEPLEATSRRCLSIAKLESRMPEVPKCKEEDTHIKRSASGSPIAASRRRSSALPTVTPSRTGENNIPTPIEDIMEISEHEFLDVKPDGALRFDRTRKATFTRKYTERPRQKGVVVEVPIRRKRPIPADEEVHVDDDIVYVRTQPAKLGLRDPDASPAPKRPKTRRSASAE